MQEELTVQEQTAQKQTAQKQAGQKLNAEPPTSGKLPAGAAASARSKSRIRRDAIVAGVGLGAMAVLAPIAVMVALPDDQTTLAAIVIAIVASLDIVVGLALYSVLRPGGATISGLAAGTRVAYGIGFLIAASFLVGSDPNVDRFNDVWDTVLLLFAVHLLLVSVAFW